jgi:hypothetical protein
MRVFVRLISPSVVALLSGACYSEYKKAGLRLPEISGSTTLHYCFQRGFASSAGILTGII